MNTFRYSYVSRQFSVDAFLDFIREHAKNNKRKITYWRFCDYYYFTCGNTGKRWEIELYNNTKINYAFILKNYPL